MKELQIILADINSRLCAAWTHEFAPYPAVNIRQGSIFDVEAAAIVSPANSFGIMDGGLDGKLRDFFGMEIERKVRTRIARDFHGELPAGMAIATETGNTQFPFLISAPTMRVPQEVSHTINAYLAMKAILTCTLEDPRIGRVAIPGLCSLSGAMSPHLVARQMRAAYERTVPGLYPLSHWREEKAFEEFLKGNTAFPPEDLERNP